MKTNAPHPKLMALIKNLNEHSPFYQQLFKKNGIAPDQIKSIHDLQKIPFTTKEDLQHRGVEFRCVSSEKFIDHVSTSGTSGKPVTLSLTDADLERLGTNECRSYEMAGLTAGDTIQLMTTMDRRFMAGLAYFLGARKLGAGIIRVGNGLPELQWETIKEMQPTALICVPSFLLKMIEHADFAQIDLSATSVKKILCIGETIRNPDFSLNALGKKITERWNVALFCTYASTEMSTAFTECEYGKGGHLQEDLIVVELVDDKGSPAKEGEPGELVVTPLGIEGMPLLRFKTGDICHIHHETCECGRTSPRVGPLLGRKNQMIKLKGTSLYPAAIFDILENLTHITNFQVVAETGEAGTDEITVLIGARHVKDISIPEITDTFRAKLRVVPKLSILSPERVQENLFPDNSRKAQKFIDKRK